MKIVKQKKIPMRRCNGCNEQKPKNQLIRIVKSPEDEISLDLTGKKSGRGAYICYDVECLRKARKSRRIDRTFEMTIPDSVYDSLEEQIKKND
jgi:predicted RNA-binding protein YlxR (DUF448 family)